MLQRNDGWQHFFHGCVPAATRLDIITLFGIGFFFLLEMGGGRGKGGSISLQTRVIIHCPTLIVPLPGGGGRGEGSSIPTERPRGPLCALVGLPADGDMMLEHRSQDLS